MNNTSCYYYSTVFLPVTIQPVYLAITSSTLQSSNSSFGIVCFSMGGRQPGEEIKHSLFGFTMKITAYSISVTEWKSDSIQGVLVWMYISSFCGLMINQSNILWVEFLFYLLEVPAFSPDHVRGIDRGSVERERVGTGRPGGESPLRSDSGSPFTLKPTLCLFLSLFPSYMIWT